MVRHNARAVRLILTLLMSIFLVRGAVINKSSLTNRDFPVNNAHASLTYDQWNALNIQNNYRKGRHLRPLVWDNVLQRDAQNWAYHLAAIDRMVHSNHRGSEGENLAWISSGKNPLSASAQMWMAESRNYWGQIIPNGNFEAYGHYTQAMWRSTTRVGMASAQARSGRIYTVARYWQAGNIYGQRPY